MNEYLYVLDYSDSTICEIHLTDEEQNMDTEQILSNHGLDIDTCSFMFTTCKIDNIIEL